MSYTNTPFEDTPPGIKINLKAAAFLEVPASQPLHYKPISVQADQQGLLALQNLTQGGTIINEAALREIASEIVRPSDVSRGVLGIQGGWNATRCSVFLHLEIESAGMIYTEILSGYTDTPAITATAVDPQIRIFPNSLLRVGQTRKVTSQGEVVIAKAQQNAQVLSPIQILNQNGQQATGQFSMRPTDILTGWQNSIVGINPDQDYDPRSQTQAGAGIASDRMRNAISARFLSRSLESYSQAMANCNDSLTNNDKFMVGMAASHAREQDFSISPLFNLLKTRTSYSQTGFFQLTELLSAVTAYDPRSIRPVPLGPGLPNAANMQTWGDYSLETRIAHRLSQAIPAIASTSLANTFNFKATFDPINGHVVVPTAYIPLFEMQAAQSFMESARSAVANVVLPEIIDNEVVSYIIEVDYTVGSDMLIKLRLNGSEQETPYTMPCYCDALAAQNIAVDQREVNANGQRMGTIIESTFTGVNPADATSHVAQTGQQPQFY